jgi:hypothetical protein
MKKGAHMNNGTPIDSIHKGLNDDKKLSPDFQDADSLLEILKHTPADEPIQEKITYPIDAFPQPIQYVIKSLNKSLNFRLTLWQLTWCSFPPLQLAIL